MKILLLGMLFILGVSFSACSEKAPEPKDDYYDRANKASKESLQGLDKDMK